MLSLFRMLFVTLLGNQIASNFLTGGGPKQSLSLVDWVCDFGRVSAQIKRVKIRLVEMA